MKQLNDQKQFNKVLTLFDRCKNDSSIALSSQIINQAIKACTQTGDLRRGMAIHHLVSSRLPYDPYIVTSLIHLYMQCGKMTTAESLFEEAKEKNIGVYGAMMKGYISHKRFEKSIDLFKQVEEPNEMIMVMLFNACAHLQTDEALALVKKVSDGMPSAFYKNTYITSCLIDALMKCGDAETAEKIFSRSKMKNQVVYGAMMKGYVKHGMLQKAIELFCEIEEPDKVNTLLLFNACARIGTKQASQVVREVSAKMPASFHSHPNLTNSLIDAYLKCGDSENAEVIFRRSTRRDRNMYAAIMKSSITDKRFQKAIDLFHEMEEPNEMVVVLLFNACAQLGTKEASEVAKKVLYQMPNLFLSNEHIITSLIDALMKCDDVETAEKIFNQSKMKSQAIFGAMLKGYVTQNEFQKAVDLFLQIEKPDEVNMLLFFNVCAQLGTTDVLDLMKKVSSTMPPSFYGHSSLTTSLCDALMKCDDICSAEKVFDRSTTKDQASYAAMMKGYIGHEMFQKAIDLYYRIDETNEVNVVLLFNACAKLATKETLQLVEKVSSNMPSSFYSNPFVINSLIDALMKHGDVRAAEAVFHKRQDNSLSCYGPVISGYVKNHMPHNAIEFYRNIRQQGILMNRDDEETNQEVITSNIIISLAVIDALAELCDPATSESILGQIPASFCRHPYIHNALIHMWGKVGCVDKAEDLFYTIKQPDHVAYTAMINAYGVNGQGKQALDLFHRTPNDFITEPTYICILHACSHSGLVDDAQRIFHEIPHKTSQIYSTMVDCLSRAGLFDEARHMIDRFEQDSPPSLPMHMALLSGCRNHRKSDLAAEVYRRMMKQFPDARDSLASAAVLLANTNASSGDIQAASDVRERMDRSNMKKSVGLSWTSVNGKFHKFRAHDQSHPRSAEIYAEVQRLMDEVARFGYEVDSSWVTRRLKEGETMGSALSGHSERLAIAWNFVENPKTSRIQVVNNLRICGDCHAVVKHIAVIRQCDIMIRDANRMHHFGKDGRCSCNDYF